MPFTIRPLRRIPLCCPVTYQVEEFEGFGTAWNVTPMGWRFSGICRSAWVKSAP